MNLRKTDSPSDDPPLVKKWNHLYAIVIVNLVFWLILFFLMRRIFE